MKRLVDDAKQRHKASPQYQANIGDVHKEEQLRQKALEKIKALDAEAAKAAASEEPADSVTDSPDGKPQR
jgi:hypothetical protein